MVELVAVVKDDGPLTKRISLNVSVAGAARASVIDGSWSL